MNEFIELWMWSAELFHSMILYLTLGVFQVKLVVNLSEKAMTSRREPNIDFHQKWIWNSDSAPKKYWKYLWSIRESEKKWICSPPYIVKWWRFPDIWTQIPTLNANISRTNKDMDLRFSPNESSMCPLHTWFRVYFCV